MMRDKDSMDIVAILLAIGISTALNCITFAILYNDIANGVPISENATQILTGWGGGMIGVIGAYVGYRAAGKTKKMINDEVVANGETQTQ